MAADTTHGLIMNILQTRKVLDADGKEHRFHSGIKENEVKLILDAMVRTEATRTLEVGMAFGTSSLAFAEGHQRADKNGFHVAIDPFQKTQWHGVGIANLRRVKFWSHTKLIEQTSDQALPHLLKTGVRFDVILVDGFHLGDTTLLDIYYATRLLKVGGVLLVDDLWMKSVRWAVRYVQRCYPHMRLDPVSHSMAQFTKLAQDTRDWIDDEKRI